VDPDALGAVAIDAVEEIADERARRDLFCAVSRAQAFDGQWNRAMIRGWHSGRSLVCRFYGHKNVSPALPYDDRMPFVIVLLRDVMAKTKRNSGSTNPTDRKEYQSRSDGRSRSDR
jgi:hypothetical protein